ncbi:MAG: hypothetical protein AABZ06_05420 [Bdellovibrionota bacterium]
MKLTTLVLTSLVAINVYAGLPDGDFKGDGLWKSARDQGTYEVSTSINGNIIAGSYTLPNGTKKEWKFEMEQTTSGFFKVKAYGTEVGKGYCLEKAEVCHYEIAVGKLVLEETLTAFGDKLYRFGSKDEGFGRIMWQESLDKN